MPSISRKNKSRLTPLAVGCSLLVLTACTGSLEAEDDTSVTIQFANFAAQDNTVSLAVDEWITEVEKATDGRIKFDVTYNAGLLSATDTVQGVRDGRADAALMTVAYYESEMPLNSITGIPYASTHPRASMAALHDLVETNTDFLSEYTDNGVWPVFFLPFTDALMGAKDEPITSIGDLAGKTVRSVGSTTVALEKVGANPAAIAYPELYESLERGVVDAYSGVVLEAVTVGGFYEVAPYVANPGQGLVSQYSIIFNDEVWEKISEEDRALLETLGRENVDTFFDLEKEVFAEACEVIREAGGSVSYWSDAAISEWQDAIGDTLLNDWRDRAGSSASEVEEEYFGMMAEHESTLGEHQSNSRLCADTF